MQIDITEVANGWLLNWIDAEGEVFSKVFLESRLLYIELGKLIGIGLEEVTK